MAVPTEATFSLGAITDANQAFLDLVDAGTGAGKVKIRDALDVLLVETILTDPAGTISVTTGQLTLTPSATATAVAAGTAAYGEITDSDDNVVLSLPAVEGDAAVSGYIALNALDTTVGIEVTMSSITVG